MADRSAPKTYLEVVLLQEIEGALGADRSHLYSLDRIREAAGLPPDPRVQRRLQALAAARRRLAQPLEGKVA